MPFGFYDGRHTWRIASWALNYPGVTATAVVHYEFDYY